MDENKAIGDGFEALLEEAVAQNFQAKMNAMPSQEETLREHPLSAEHTRKMEKLFAEERRKNATKKLLSLAKTALFVLLVSAALFATVLAFSPKVRAAVWDAVVRFLDDHTEIEFREPEGSVIKEAWDFSPQFIPEGYTLVSEDINEISYLAVYKDLEDNMLIFSVNPPTVINVDSDYLTYHTEVQNGITYHVNESPNNENYSIITWSTDNFAFNITGIIPIDELLAMARSIT